MPRRVQMEWTGLSGAPFLSTFWFEGDSVPAAQDLVEAVRDAFDAQSGLFSSDLTFTTLPEVTSFSTPSTPTGTVATSPVSQQGSDSGGLMARATQGLLQLRTGAYVGARQIQGRLFLPGITVNHVNGDTGAPAATYVASANLLGAALLDLDLMVASRTQDTFYPVGSVNTWSEFAVLRSRRD